jgi:hypothetical protein
MVQGVQPANLEVWRVQASAAVHRGREGCGEVKQKREIKPGQIWRDKRDHARQIRVTWFGESWDKASKCVVYDYEVAAGTEIVNQRNGRTVKEKCFRGDYELLTDAPTEAQKERRCDE